MLSGPKSRRRCALVALAAVLPLRVAWAQQSPLAPDEPIAIAITVQASNSVGQTAADEFLTGFITTAVRLEGPKLFSCITNAAKLRPDLAARIVVCALNIAHLNSRPFAGHVSCASIDQIVRAVVTGAPQNAASIVKAAIKSEPYAPDCIIAAALAAAPDEESEINDAAGEMSPTSMFVWAGRINPVEDLPSSNVNSPEQPPAGP
jgi:hypothetical protein